MSHSDVVGGSTAKRVMTCPGSVRLCQQVPKPPASSYANEGTLLHKAMDRILGGAAPKSVIGMTYEGITLTQDLFDEKIDVAMRLLDEVDPDEKMEYECESRVGFGELIPDVFGTTDVLGKINGHAVVLDWKFGSGVPVEAAENAQLMFYAAAAMRTPETQWAFMDADEVELIIIQPPHIRRWTTTIDRIMQFEQDLADAVKLALKPDAPLKHGDHCRWCHAKPICPVMNGAVDRALKTKLDGIDAATIGAYLKNAELLEQWIGDLRDLAHRMLEGGNSIPKWKLVQKRAVRKWVNEDMAKNSLMSLGLTESDMTDVSFKSPAQVEKVLKKHKLDMPEDLVVASSSGTTIASEDDPRPAVVQLGQQLTAALSKIV